MIYCRAVNARVSYEKVRFPIGGSAVSIRCRVGMTGVVIYQQTKGVSAVNVIAQHVEGIVTCPKCRGIGAEIQHDGSKCVCSLCGGAGQLLENDTVAK